MIANYDLETAEQKIILDKGVRDIPNNLVTNLVPGEKFISDINASLSYGSAVSTINNIAINKNDASDTVSFRSFKLKGSKFLDVFQTIVERRDTNNDRPTLVTEASEADLLGKIRITFNDTNNSFFDLPLTQLNKEIMINRLLTASSYTISIDTTRITEGY